jgi:hypothetical protein
VRAVLLGLILLASAGFLLPQAACSQNRAAEAPSGADTTARPAPPSSEPTKPATSAGLEASPLDTILMRDAKGNLVPVIGMPFEEFEQLLRTKKGLSPAAAPAYTLEAVSLVGKANERVADLQLTATVRVREPGWIRVPLHRPRAGGGQPLKPAGAGAHFMPLAAAAGGYVCWLNGNDSRPHVISLSISVALASAGEERRLAIALPRATESSLRLVVPSPAADASLISGEGIATTNSLDELRTEVVILGAAGDLQLAWRPRHEVGKGPVQLDASGEIAVRIQSEHRITSDARFRVRGYGPPLESFRIRLPPGMELLPAPPGGGYSVTAVDLETPAANGDQQRSEQLVEVRLDKPANTAEVLLRAQREADVAPAKSFAPARFDVIGAIRQRGTIDFFMDGEWQLDWHEDKSVHRVDLLPESAAGRVVARFEYFQQPCNLLLQVSARPARVSVEPVHAVYVEAERVRIESTLKYRFRGARAAGLKFDMADWVFDRLTPDALLDFPLDRAAKGELQIPFRPGAAPPAELELKLEAHRDLPQGAEQLSLRFPRPLADIVAPATILVFTADNIELTPQNAHLISLSPETLTARSPDKPHPSFLYRDRGGEEPAHFVAGLRRLERVTTTSARATVRIDRQQVQIEQRLEYRVAHEPLRDLTFLVPREIASSENFNLLVDGQALPVRPFPDPSSSDDRLLRLQVTLPHDLIGQFEATAHYSLPLNWDRKAPLPWTLPLVLPADDETSSFLNQHVEFHLASDTTIEPDQPDADEVAQATAVFGATNTYAWDEVQSYTPWSLAPGRGVAAGTAHIRQMWVQTWLTPQVRQERVALRISTPQDSLRLRLPPGVNSASLLAAVDSEKVDLITAQSSGAAGQVVSLPLKNRGADCVVEIWYSLDPPPRWLGLIHGDLRTAQVLEAEAPRRAYWQLVLPEYQHLLSLPQELSAEMAWSPDRFRLIRRPVMDQRQLEGWLKASRQDPLPSAANEYLFGAVARWPTLSIDIAERRFIVASASAAVLLIGMLLLNIIWLRSPSVLFVLAVLLAGMAFIWPDAAILIGQGSLLGIAVGAVVAGWNWLIRGAAIREARPAPSAIVKSSLSPSTHSGAARLDRSARLSTTHHTPLMEARP